MPSKKTVILITLLLLFCLGTGAKVLSAPQPLSPEEEELMREMEQKSNAQGQQAGSYQTYTHVLTSVIQIASLLGLLSLGGLGAYALGHALHKRRAASLSGEEQRRWARLNAEQCDLKCKLQTTYEQTGEYLSKIRDISRGGAGLEFEQSTELAPGDKIKLKFEKEKGAPVQEVSGIIRWAAGTKMGVQFENLLESSFEALQSFVRQQEPAVVRM